MSMSELAKNRTGKKISRKELILDAAEELFSIHGYDGVTLRQVSKKAGVKLALIDYHFGRKRDLFESVFLRRAKILNDARLKALEECERAAGPEGPSVESIIEAFLRPLEFVQESEDPGWKHYCALVAYINNSSVWGNVMIGKHFNPLVLRFIEALKKAMPGVREEEIFWGYHFLSGALTLTFAQTGRIDELSGGLCKSSDFQAIYNRMIPFFSAGFKDIEKDNADKTLSGA